MKTTFQVTFKPTKQVEECQDVQQVTAFMLRCQQAYGAAHARCQDFTVVRIVAETLDAAEFWEVW